MITPAFKALEFEIARCAALDRDTSGGVALKPDLRHSADAIRAADTDLFHALDDQLHKLLYLSARQAFAFDSASENKALLDRPLYVGTH